MSNADLGGGGRRVPPLGARAGEDIKGPQTQAERDTGTVVLGQSLIGLGTALINGDPAMAARFKRILMQVQDVLASGRAEAAAGQQERTGRQDGVPAQQTGAGLQLPGM